MATCTPTVRPSLPLLLLLLSIGHAAIPGGLRAQDGADAASLADAGWAAAEAQRFGDAYQAFAAASELTPQDASVWLGRGYTGFMLGQDDDAEVSLENAVALAPRLTDASRLLGQLYRRTGRLDQAVATYRAALEHAPGDADLEARLEEWTRDTRIQDRFAKTRGTHFQVVFEGHRDEALARRVVGVLEGAYRQVGSVLRKYPSRPVTVILYTEQQFHDITRAPAWAAGVFDGQIRLPVGGALERRDELERVLVHEYVHVLVAQLGGRTVPHWVNEGLAGALEPGGLARARAVLARTDARLSLEELHRSFGGLSGYGAAVAYAQSAVAVDRMMASRGASAVVVLLEDLARGVAFESAFRHRMGLRYDEFARRAD